MESRTRGLRDTIVRGLAKVGLVWAVALLGALFMVMSAQGQRDDGGYSMPTGSQASPFTVAPGGAPSTAGLVLALVILSAGLTVLAIGATRERRNSPAISSAPTAFRHRGGLSSRAA